MIRNLKFAKFLLHDSKIFKVNIRNFYKLLMQDSFVEQRLFLALHKSLIFASPLISFHLEKKCRNRKAIREEEYLFIA